MFENRYLFFRKFFLWVIESYSMGYKNLFHGHRKLSIFLKNYLFPTPSVLTDDCLSSWMIVYPRG